MRQLPRTPFLDNLPERPTIRSVIRTPAPSVEVSGTLAKGRLPLYTSFMVAILRELFRHQAYADALMLMAIKRNQVALIDQELRRLIHHILVSHHRSSGCSFRDAGPGRSRADHSWTGA